MSGQRVGYDQKENVAELDEITARYQPLTDELDRRARTAWTRAS
jgi:hypothetical protein